MEKKPHKHAEVIRAWADGAQIEYRQPDTGKWILCYDTPAFMADYEYRVKPAREYPETRATIDDLLYAACHAPDDQHSVIATANAALRHAIDNGQVVTREEFKRLTDELGRAVCSMKAYGYTDEGGDLWKPPVGRNRPIY